MEAACEEEPRNPYALRNLGACLLALGKDLPKAEEYLRAATEILPDDQQSWIGLGQAYDVQGKSDDADAAYIRAIEIDPYNQIAEMARTARSKIAEKNFKKGAGTGTRTDAVLYCFAALEKFAAMTRDQVQRIGFEIAAVGTKGINVNDPDSQYSLSSMLGTFSGLQLVCYE